MNESLIRSLPDRQLLNEAEHLRGDVVVDELVRRFGDALDIAAECVYGQGFDDLKNVVESYVELCEQHLRSSH